MARDASRIEHFRKSARNFAPRRCFIFGCYVRYSSIQQSASSTAVQVTINTRIKKQQYLVVLLPEAGFLIPPQGRVVH